MKIVFKILLFKCTFHLEVDLQSLAPFWSAVRELQNKPWTPQLRVCASITWTSSFVHLGWGWCYAFWSVLPSCNFNLISMIENGFVKLYSALWNRICFLTKLILVVNAESLYIITDNFGVLMHSAET